MVGEFTELIRSRCYWQTVIRPERFQQNRVQDYHRLFPIVSESAVSLRGWEFPLVAGKIDQRSDGEDWVGEVIDRDELLELWRIYQSGQFVSIRGLWHDWKGRTSKNPNGQGPSNSLPLWDTIRRITEIYEFAARLSLTEAGDEMMRVHFKIDNLRGRTLVQDSSRKTPLRHHVFTANSFSFPAPASAPISRESLAAEPRQFAADALAELFLRAQWPVGSAVIRTWQDELSTRL